VGWWVASWCACVWGQTQVPPSSPPYHPRPTKGLSLAARAAAGAMADAVESPVDALWDKVAQAVKNGQHKKVAKAADERESSPGSALDAAASHRSVPDPVADLPTPTPPQS
jgi:hypothetical protein